MAGQSLVYAASLAWVQMLEGFELERLGFCQGIEIKLYYSSETMLLGIDPNDGNLHLIP